MEKDTIRVYLEKHQKDAFQRMYPFTMSRFVRNAIKKAIQDKVFFQSIYFEEA